MSTDFFIPDPEGLVPSAEGYFGAFGGKFIPEALVAAVDEVAAEYEKAKADPAFAAELNDLLVNYTGRPSAADRGPAVRRARRRRPGLPQARGPQPHRLAQDQQRARPGAADQADGQDPGHRRDRRRPARRRHRHRLRAVRPRVHHLHGRGRHRAPGAQRRPDADARRRGHRRSTSGSRTLKDAINEAFRDWVANVDRTHYLFGTVAGPHPFPAHGARLPPGHRRRGAPADAGAHRPAAGRGRAPASAAAPTRSGIFHAFLPDAGGPAGRLRGRRRTASRPASTRPP